MIGITCLGWETNGEIKCIRVLSHQLWNYNYFACSLHIVSTCVRLFCSVLSWQFTSISVMNIVQTLDIVRLEHDLCMRYILLHKQTNKRLIAYACFCVVCRVVRVHNTLPHLTTSQNHHHLSLYYNKGLPIFGHFTINKQLIFRCMHSRTRKCTAQSTLIIHTRTQYACTVHISNANEMNSMVQWTEDTHDWAFLSHAWRLNELTHQKSLWSEGKHQQHHIQKHLPHISCTLLFIIQSRTLWCVHSVAIVSILIGVVETNRPQSIECCNWYGDPVCERAIT